MATRRRRAKRGAEGASMKQFGLIAAAAGAVLLVTRWRQDVGARGGGAEHGRDLQAAQPVRRRVRDRALRTMSTTSSDDTLVEGAINGMLTALDPHSNYLNAKNFNDMKVQTRGEFGGLGIEVSMENGLVKVVSPIDDTPAAQCRAQARRSDHPSRRQPGAGSDLARGGREDARPGQQRHHADRSGARGASRSTSS